MFLWASGGSRYKADKAPGDDNWNKLEQVMKALEETGKLDGAAPTAVKRAKRVIRQIKNAAVTGRFQSETPNDANVPKGGQRQPATSATKSQAKMKKGEVKAATEKADGPPPAVYRFNKI